MSEYVVQAIANSDALVALAPQWWQLWERTPAATPFQSPAWLIPWWQSFCPGRLQSAAVRFCGRLVAFAGFYQEDYRSGSRLLPLGLSVSDYQDVLVDPAHENAIGPLLLHHFLRGRPDDVLCCQELGPGATALRMWSQYIRAGELTQQSACPVLPLRSSTETLKSSVPKTKLRKVRLAQHRMQRRKGEVKTFAIGTASGFLGELFRLHATRWRTRGLPGVLNPCAVQRFHVAALPLLMEAGLACPYGLEIAGQTVAAYYGLQHGSHAYAYLGGFDPEFAYESPGTILIAHAIEEAGRNGMSNFHFLRGRESYKYEWGAVDRWNHGFEIHGFA